MSQQIVQGIIACLGLHAVPQELKKLTPEELGIKWRPVKPYQFDEIYENSGADLQLIGKDEREEPVCNYFGCKITGYVFKVLGYGINSRYFLLADKGKLHSFEQPRTQIELL